MFQRYSFVFLFQMEDSISTGQKSLQLLGTPLGVLKAQVEEEVRPLFRQALHKLRHVITVWMGTLC